MPFGGVFLAAGPPLGKPGWLGALLKVDEAVIILDGVRLKNPAALLIVGAHEKSHLLGANGTDKEEQAARYTISVLESLLAGDRKWAQSLYWDVFAERTAKKNRLYWETLAKSLLFGKDDRGKILGLKLHEYLGRIKVSGIRLLETVEIGG